MNPATDRQDEVDSRQPTMLLWKDTVCSVEGMHVEVVMHLHSAACNCVGLQGRKRTGRYHCRAGHQHTPETPGNCVSHIAQAQMNQSCQANSLLMKASQAQFSS